MEKTVRNLVVRTAWASLLALAACGSTPPDAPANGGDPTGVPPGGSPSDRPPAPPFDGGIADADAAASSEVDPTKPGPFPVTELDGVANVPATGDSVPIHAVIPKGAGPFPVIVLAHGFQLPPSQYYGTVRFLATFGFVTLTADYPAGFTSSNNVRDAKNVAGALDWAKSAPETASVIDIAKSGVAGHSRGGKAAVLAAALDKRFVAVLGIDPVDVKSPLACNTVTECPDSRDAVAALALPTAFLGETTDGSGGSFGQACAPSEGNFQTFYAKTRSPSYAVTITGANHMSFLDDPQSCGFTCSVCNAATAKHEDVLALSRAYAVAFFQRHLRGAAAYDAYLDGTRAKALWVSTGLATITSK